LLEPVLMAPLRREWEAVKAKCLELWPKVQEAAKQGTKAQAVRARKAFDKTLHDFLGRLAEVKVLDPACGSGNFLYVAINLLLDLEKQVIAFGSGYDFSWLPHVRPTQLLGIEINPFAQELAQVVIWIGYLQWMLQNGFVAPSDPVLAPFENIQNMDAILDLSDPENPKEPTWPAAEFIVGNPPFLGNKRMRSELGVDYCNTLWRLYADRIPAMSDLCCYFFEKGRQLVGAAKALRVGLLATTGIKQVGARHVLERINDTCKIFFAVSDREWMLEGAAVRISMIGFSRAGTEETVVLDGMPRPRINPDLTSGSDLTQKKTLAKNSGVCFMGTTKVGAFDIDLEHAIKLLGATNPNGRPNSDVLRPFRNGSDLVRRSTHRWIIDFGVNTTIDVASLYQDPFEHLVKYVKPGREQNNRKSRAKKWWLLGETLPAFRRAVGSQHRYIGTPRVSKHRVFVWLDPVVLPDSKVIAFALSGDVDFGVIHSSVHRVWTAATSGLHGGERPTYNPTLSFETFPFLEPAPDQQAAIAAAAKELDTLRTNWLNPPEWTKQEVLEFPGSATGPWARYVHDGDARGIGVVRYPRLIPRDDEGAKKLQKRTLTNLYNERPTWLDLAHKKLDTAVAAAYGWPADLTDEEVVARILALNLAQVKR
jgi:type II restriction/modification system DNA methylase subunit YeeA